MKFAFALVALTTLAFVPAANAADARLADCSQLAKQVSAALEAAQPNDLTDTARREANIGRNYCGLQMYKVGVAHYSKALQLLGKS
jgi:hypothetical protein